MKAFVLDTSLQGVTLGLVSLSGESFEILEQYGSQHPQEAAARLPELCASLLKNHKLSTQDLDLFLVSHGPGSFTGIKIGLSFASGWQRAGTSIKIYGVSSVQGLLMQLPKTHSLLLPATQTAGYFTKHEQSVTALGVIDLSLPYVAARVNPSSQTHESLSAKELGHVEILGSWPKVEAWLTEQGISWSTYQNPDVHTAVISGMVQEFIAKRLELSEGKLVPVYLRKSAPEEKLEQAQSQK